MIIDWNCGAKVRPPTLQSRRVRNRQAKNAFTILMLSRGVPMFVAGDEIRRTQRGNNNAYCQDNEIRWIDWSLGDAHADVVRSART